MVLFRLKDFDGALTLWVCDTEVTILVFVVVVAQILVYVAH
jgi:hypothetical protein